MDEEFKNYLNMVISMSLDCLRGGITRETYVANLEGVVTNLKKSSKEEYNLKEMCRCAPNERKSVLINHSAIWGDGDVVCNNCKCFVRSYDSG